MLNVFFAAALGFAAAEGSVGIDLTLADGARSDVDVVFTDGSRNTVSLSPLGQQSQYIWERYARRARNRHANAKKCAKYSEAMVRFDCGREPWFNFHYAILPYFDGYEGVYDHSEVLAHIREWREELPSLRETVFSFEFYFDEAAGRNAAWLNGRFAGWSSATSRIEKLNVRASAGAKCVERAPKKREGRFLALDPQPRPLSVNPLMKNAKLTLDPGISEKVGAPIEPWPLDASFDTGLHRETCVRDDIFRYGMLNRSAFANGPEYLQYSVPRRAYSCAWILCVALKTSHEDDRLSVLTTEFGSYANSRQQLATDMTSLVVAPKVGELVYVDLEGTCVTADVKLVRQPISSGLVLPEINGKEKYLEFSFTGGGTWNEMPRSNVQILGATLVASPVTMDIVERVHANVFAAEDKKTTAVAITAYEDAEVTLGYSISDERFNLLKSGEPIKLKLKAGERVEKEIDLDMKSPGWYQLDYALSAASGEPLIAHEAAFSILAKDDREAGFESPFAAWPQFRGYSAELEKRKPDTIGLLGYHGCNGDRMEVLNLLWKEGVHKGWHEVTKGEAEFPERHYTFSETGSDLKFMFQEPISDEELQAAFKKNGDKFEDIRSRFPHCDTVAIMHENEPRHISREAKGEKTPKVSPVKSPAIEKLEKYCDYMHARFPDVKLRIANNSASAERVAQLARDGFDLNKVDELGSEVRGFSAMPELAADLEAPGTMWALRETGRMFGMTNALIGASAEFVFRPERRVLREDPDFMDQTNYAIRDYLVSLGFGCRSISSGHAEDCADGYYDTDWGSSGHLRRWPYSYPKRMYTGFAVLSRALDCGRFQRRLPTGDNLAYALEFRRERKNPDFAYALWTPEYTVELKVKFPKGGFFSGTKVRKIDAFGREEQLDLDKENEVTLKIGATPCYLIASAAAEIARVTDRPLVAVKSQSRSELWTPAKCGYSVVKCGAPAVEYAQPGEFENAVVESEFGPSLKATLKKTGDCPKVFSEYQYLEFDSTMWVDEKNPLFAYGVMVKGNGSFGRVGLVFRRQRGESDAPETKILWPGKNGYVDFTGWQMMTVHPMANMMRAVPEGYSLRGLVVGSARTVLDPLEMQPVEGDVEIGGVYRLEGVMPPMKDPDFLWMQWRLRHPLAGWL